MWSNLFIYIVCLNWKHFQTYFSTLYAYFSTEFSTLTAHFKAEFSTPHSRFQTILGPWLPLYLYPVCVSPGGHVAVLQHRHCIRRQTEDRHTFLLASRQRPLLPQRGMRQPVSAVHTLFCEVLIYLCSFFLLCSPFCTSWHGYGFTKQVEIAQRVINVSNTIKIHDNLHFSPDP